MLDEIEIEIINIRSKHINSPLILCGDFNLQSFALNCITKFENDKKHQLTQYKQNLDSIKNEKQEVYNKLGALNKAIDLAKNI